MKIHKNVYENGCYYCKNYINCAECLTPKIFYDSDKFTRIGYGYMSCFWFDDYDDDKLPVIGYEYYDENK